MADDLNSLLEKVNNKLTDSALFYFANDPEREIGLELLLKNFHLLHIDASQYLPLFDVKKIKYFCLEETLGKYNSVFRSSLKLITHDLTRKYLVANGKKTNYAQTFKISPAFEHKARELQFKPVNPASHLNRTFENKISQFNELQNLNISKPEAIIITLKDAVFEELTTKFGVRFVVQFDRGHTGSGTFFIENEPELNRLKLTFPERSVKISEFVEGNAYTLNACITSKGVFLGGLSYQITGTPGVANSPSATIGNDFSYRPDIDAQMLSKIISEMTVLGEFMKNKGFRGLFGIDLIVNRDGFKLIEINARQSASVPMFTKMQLLEDQVPLALLHLAEFLEADFELETPSYNEFNLAPKNYSQVFLRTAVNMTVAAQIEMGIYRLQSDNTAINRDTGEVRPNTIFLDEAQDKPLIFYSNTYSIEDLTKQAGFIILAPIKGRVLKAGAELARLQLAQSAIADGKLAPWIIETLTALRSYQS